MLLALIVWIGGIIFFAFVEAPAVFTVLSSREMAGNVVSRSLASLHWIGIVSGLGFLICSLLYNWRKHQQLKPFSASHVFIVLMLALTMFSHFCITPRMHALRTEMSTIDNISLTDARRVTFDRLHEWSTRSESGVLLCGLVVVILTARRFGNSN